MTMGDEEGGPRKVSGRVACLAAALFGIGVEVEAGKTPIARVFPRSPDDD